MVKKLKFLTKNWHVLVHCSLVAVHVILAVFLFHFLWIGIPRGNNGLCQQFIDELVFIPDLVHQHIVFLVFDVVGWVFHLILLVDGLCLLEETRVLVNELELWSVGWNGNVMDHPEALVLLSNFVRFRQDPLELRSQIHFLHNIFEGLIVLQILV